MRCPQSWSADHVGAVELRHVGIAWAGTSVNFGSASLSRSVCRRRSAASFKRSCFNCPAGVASADSIWLSIQVLVALRWRTLHGTEMPSGAQKPVRAGLRAEIVDGGHQPASPPCDENDSEGRGE